MKSIVKSRFAYFPSVLTLAALTACGGGSETENASAESQDITASAETSPSDTRATAQATTTTWSKIADEWTNFNVSGTRKVRFGAGSKWIEKSVSGNGRCDSNFFGSDPALLVVKTCEVATATETNTTTPVATAPAATSSWTKVAAEWAYFTVSGTKTVRYGAGTKWVQKLVTNSAMCTNSWFGSDPAPTIVKSCEVLNTTTASLTPPATSTPTATAPSTDSSTGTTELWKKPFASTSPWNTRIPNNATYASASDRRVSSFRNVSDGYKLRVNTNRFTQWIYRATASDPQMTIRVSVRNLDSQRGSAFPREGAVTLRVPAIAKPDPGLWSGVNADPWADNPDGKDAHMTIIDPDGIHAHEFWHVERDAGTGAIKAVAYTKVPLNGDGIFINGEGVQSRLGNYYNPAFTSYGWGAARAYGGSSTAGVIRQGEITQGPLQHALFMSIPQEILGYPAAGQLPLYPAAKDDGRSHGYTGSILMGTRFAIPRSVDLNTLGLSPAGLRLATALQEYGAFIADQSGGVRLNSEGSSAQADGNALNAQAGDLNKIHSLLTIVNP